MLAAAGLGLALVALVGCASTSDAHDPDITTAATPHSATPTPSSGASAPAATASSAPAGTASDSGAGGAGSSGSGSLPRCDVDRLTGTTTKNVQTDVSIDIPITLRNSGTTACTVQGWPGASFVTGQNGTQVGPGATLDRSTPHPSLTLQPGDEAHFTLRVVRPMDDSNAMCAPRNTDGVRVIPPGSTRSLFVEAPGYQACSQGVDTLSVTGITAGAAS